MFKYNRVYKFHSLALVFIAVCVALACPTVVRGAEETPSKPIAAKAAILVEAGTGRVLYAKNADERMYPASMVKTLTALVLLDYLKPYELVVAGAEVSAVPVDSLKAGHENGESISVENLVRGMMMQSSNETCSVAAKAVVDKLHPGAAMSYNDVEELFCGLMNEKAKALGAKDSNFTNPHGYHDDELYTTASDMALITLAAMENPFIAKIAAEKEFSGNGAGVNPDPSLKTKNYNWATHNLLIKDGEFNYPNATGTKTGATEEAGECLAAAATKDGLSLVSVVFDSPDTGRWYDTVNLFEFGFSTYQYREVQAPDTAMGEVSVEGGRLGGEDKVGVLAKGAYTALLSEKELSRIERTVEYNKALLVSSDEEEYPKDPREAQDEKKPDAPRFFAPIAEGDELGEVIYTLDGETIFTDKLVSTGTVEERTKVSDREYYMDKAKSVVFSKKAIPFWAGGAVAVIVVVILLRWLTVRRRQSFYRLRKRY